MQPLARLRSRSCIIDRIDLPRDPLEVRKATISVKVAPSLCFKEQIEADGPTVFAHACKLGLEGIMIFGPKADGTYVIEFRTAASDSPAISIPRTETAVVWYFQERSF